MDVIVLWSMRARMLFDFTEYQLGPLPVVPVRLGRSSSIQVAQQLTYDRLKLCALFFFSILLDRRFFHCPSCQASLFHRLYKSKSRYLLVMDGYFVGTN